MSATSSKPLFPKVLVANRGEIAVRILRTLREMGIPSVAVASEADRDALHVRMADEVVVLGPAPSRESYLVVEKIVDACKKTGATAVHPGYGFLSEKAELPRALAAAGITFIGPPPEAMDAMGYKTSARERMIAAGVPVVPGGTANDPEGLKQIARELGYPVMLKAASGGGGKGMRFVDRPEDLAAAYERAQSEALKSFGDDDGVPGEGHGRAAARRDPGAGRPAGKPAARLRPRLLGAAAAPEGGGGGARRLAVSRRAGEAHGRGRGARRQGRGVLLRGHLRVPARREREFYFLEMNTRLQVEHPVTELITGLDLVREMVRIAAGEKLGYEQSEVLPRGHAIQCRVYAEDPATGFLPSPGTVEVLRTPSGPGVRDDSGAYEGCTIPSFYDPLVSKLCVWAPTRDLAIQKMRRALSEYVVLGIATNLPFHLALLSHPDFVSGRYDTGFIPRNEATLLTGGTAGDAADAFAVAAAVHAALTARKNERASAAVGPAPGGLSPWRMGAIARLR
jgi:acetyl-CoA carboxylase biotin carboxylase subunit